MRKGFTLIEIIIALLLISLIGTSTIVVVNKTKNNKELETLTKKILEAANVYVEVEKDNKGITYSYGINNGGKGVRISLKTLVNTGYVKESEANNIKKLSELTNDEEYYVLLANANDLCETGATLTIASWIPETRNDVIYLCNHIDTGGGSDGGYNPNTLYGKIVKEYEENGISGCMPELEDGLCYYQKNGKTENNIGIYYYTGQINNNILDIGGQKFYIVRTTEDGGVKIISKDYINFGGFELNVIGHPNYTTSILDKVESGSSLGSFYKYNSSPKTRISYNFSSNMYFPDSFSFNCIYQKNGLTNCANPITYSRNSNNNDINNWSDTSKNIYTLTNNSTADTINSSIEIESPIHTHIYKPIEEWYNNNLELYNKIIKTDYNWCIKTKNVSTSINWSTVTGYGRGNEIYFPTTLDFTCESNDYFQHSNFGLLNLPEYYSIIKKTGYRSEIYMYQKIFDERDSREIIYDFSFKPMFGTTAFFIPGSASTSEKGEVYIRPALVLKGDLQVSGEGTNENPYVININ